jgi:hypothetical protein
VHLHETYADMKANPRMPDSWFEPASLR